MLRIFCQVCIFCFKKVFFCQPFFEKIQTLCRGPPFKKLSFFLSAFFCLHFLSAYSFCKFSNLVSLPCPFSCIPSKRGEKGQFSNLVSLPCPFSCIPSKRGEKEGFPLENQNKNTIFVRKTFGKPKQKYHFC